MARIVLLLGLVVLALFWALGRRRGPTGSGRSPQAPTGRESEPRTMVRCARCGLHLPQTEAVQDSTGHWFCSEAHRAQGAAE